MAMTWGSNASFALIPCRYCGEMNVDDCDMRPTTHERSCAKRSMWQRIRAWWRVGR